MSREFARVIALLLVLAGGCTCARQEPFAGPIVRHDGNGALDTCDQQALRVAGDAVLYPFQSLAATPLTVNAELYRLDAQGVLMYNYSGAYDGLGWAYNPMFIARRALALAVDREREDAPVAERERQLRAQLDWLVDNGVKHDKPVPYVLWLYPFPVDKFHVPAGWSSALAQARIAVALQYGFAAFGERRYCEAAQGALAALNVTMPAGGVSTMTAPDEVWFEEYAHSSAPSTLVLNGHLSALAGLAVLHSDLATALFEAGVRSTETLLPRFDAGFLSRYSITPDWLAPALGYNVMHAYQLSWLYEETGVPSFAAAAMRYLDYADDGGSATADASVNAATHGPERIDLSLGSSYWSGPLPAQLTWHLDETRPTDGIDVVGYFLKAAAVPRDLTVEVEAADGSREAVAAVTGNEQPWFRLSWAARDTRRIHLTVTRSNGWAATALYGLRASYADRRTGFLPSFGALRNNNLPQGLTTGAGWTPPAQDGWLLIRPVHSRGGTLHVSPCPDTLRLGWFAGAALDELVPAGVEHIRDADGCRFVAPAGAWLKFEFEGAVKRPVFRWIDA